MGEAKNCTACGTELTRIRNGLEVGYRGGGLINLFGEESILVDVYSCPQCGRLELYRFAQEPPPVQNEVPETITCPKCGAEHGFYEAMCPQCGYRYTPADSRRFREGEKSERSRKKKPDWEL